MAEEVKERIVNVDIGGLHGRAFIEQAKRHPEQRFVVIDPHPGTGPPPEVPKEEMPPNLTYIVGQVEKTGGGIPFSDASVDRVLIEQVFDPVDRKLWKPLFTETGRILKKGGSLEIIDLSRNEDEIKWSLPSYGFDKVKSRSLEKEEGGRISQTLGSRPEAYSRPILITATKT